MNDMKQFISIALSALLLVALSGCDFNINNNPNEGTKVKMTPDLLLPHIEHSMAAFTGASNTDWDSADGQRWYFHWLGCWARSGQYGSNTDVESYVINGQFNQSVWNDLFRILENVNSLETQAQERKNPGYEGIAKILKVYGFHILVDSYGDLPYSESFKGNMTPKHDKAEDIYTDLIAQLDAADKLLQQEINEDTDPKLANVDKVFKGKAQMWRKFGNTLRLRLVLRMVNVKDQGALKAEVDKIVANGAGFLGAGEDVEASFGYKNDNGKVSPFWVKYYKNHAGKAIDAYNRAGEYLISKLNNGNDPRIKAIFRPVGDKWGNGYVGVEFGNDNGAYKAEHGPNATSMVSGPGLAKSYDQPAWIMPAFESLFLQAEAIQRGLLAGDAKSVYEAAVKDDFRWLEVGRFENPLSREGEDPQWADATLDGIVNEYLAGRAGSWDSSSDKLELILNQKYIALAGVNGYELWSDYRRTGIPTDIPKSVYPSASSNHIPNLLVYPPSEVANNKAHVVVKDPQRDKIFWAK